MICLIRMKRKQYFRWNAEKNEQLKQTRDICFEQVVLAVEQGKLLGILDHHNMGKYPNQEVLLVNVNEYVYMVPFVMENSDTFFLKTIIPNRKATKKYLGGESNG
jgi:uncharacterized DUF497 family protein